MNNILWSKGLSNKTQYQMAHTGYRADNYEIIREINKCNGILWIRNNGYDLDIVSCIVDKLTSPIKIVITDGDTSLGDYKIKTIKKLINSNNIIKMYFQNYENFNDKLLLNNKITYFPIGLDLHTIETSIGNNPYCKYALLLKMRNIPKTINKCLIDFKVTPRSNNRLRIINESKNNKNIKILNDRLSICELYNLYSTYKFIICAEGGGLDCHRQYEAWLCGCVVLTHHSSLDNMFNEFPTIYINDFSKITIEDLNKYWDYTINKRATENIISKFKYDFWLK